MPFTYLIGWSAADKWYIGSRWAKGCAPSDLWSTYFTSSKYVGRFRKEHGEPDVIEIGQVFDSKKAALAHEIFLLKMNRAKERDCFLNKAVGGVFDPSDPEIRRKSSEAHRGKKQTPQSRLRKSQATRGRRQSPEHTEKIRKALTGKKLSPEHCAAISGAKRGNTNHKGKLHSEETKQKIRIAKTGALHSEETKLKMSAAHRGRKLPLVTCPTCGKVGGATAMKQWHFANCKFLKE